MDLAGLVELETQVWQALVDGDPAADAALLSDDFVGVYPTGFADRTAHAEQLRNGPTVARFELFDPQILVVSDDAAILVYRGVYWRVSADAPAESMYVSSLWCRRGDRWLNVFSQDTPDTGIAVV